MRILALLLFFPSLAFGQGLTTLAPGQTGGGKVLWAAPFATAGCYASGQTAGASSAISITRTTKGTFIGADGYTLTECASGEFRVAPDGLLVEPQRTNYAQQSNTMSTGTAATSPWALNATTVTTVAGAPLTGTWAEVTNTTSLGAMYSGPLGTPSTTTIAASVWAAKPSGTGYASVYAYAASVGTFTNCYCSRSDGGACSATFFDTNKGCLGEVSDLGTTPVRIAAWGTLNAAITTSAVIGVCPGRRSVSTGTTRFTGAQLEVGTYPTSLIVTTTTSATRNADAVSATVPAVPSKWQIAGAFKKNVGAPWTSGTPWSLGTAAGANSASLTMGAANLVFTVIDGSTASKTCTVTSPGYAAGSSQSLTAKDLAGTLSLTGGCTQAGAGSGSFGTAPTTLYLGQTSAGDQFSGFVKSLTLNKVTK